MTLFRSELHQDIWIEHHCEQCYFGSRGCLIIDKVVMSKNPRKPVEWERNTRKNVTMAETIKCNMETRTPPRVERPIVDIDVPMFDLETTDVAMDSDHA